jgi:hypothetical protein
MPKKFKLDVDFENETVLIGISSHLKDYRLVWLINKQLGFKLIKIKDFSYKTNKPKKEKKFSCYYFQDESNISSYFLLSNHSNLDNSNLINEHKQTDYILFCENPSQNKNIKLLISDIKKTPNILTAYEISQFEIKYINNIISDLELHINNIEKEEKEKKKNHNIL